MGEEETGEGVACQLHMYTIVMYHGAGEKRMVRHKSTFKNTNSNNASCKVLSFAQIASGTLDIAIRHSSRLYQPL